MPNPKRRHSSTRRDKRRASNWKMSTPTLVKCSNPACDAMHMSHHMCPSCGTYNERTILSLRRGQTAEA